MIRPTGRWSFGKRGGFVYDVELERSWPCARPIGRGGKPAGRL